MFLISCRVCPWQALPSWSNVCGQGQEPTQEWSNFSQILDCTEKNLTGTNTLTYYEHSKIMAVKKFFLTLGTNGFYCHYTDLPIRDIPIEWQQLKAILTTHFIHRADRAVVSVLGLKGHRNIVSCFEFRSALYNKNHLRLYWLTFDGNTSPLGIMETFWSKFTHIFCKPDHFITQGGNSVILWNGLAFKKRAELHHKS